jgi:hypothetical protein
MYNILVFGYAYTQKQSRTYKGTTTDECFWSIYFIQLLGAFVTENMGTFGTLYNMLSNVATPT